MRSSPRAGDDDLQPAISGVLAIGDHLARHPVSRHDIDLVGNPELIERLSSPAHDGPIAVTAHDDAHEGSEFRTASDRTFRRW